MPNQEESKDGQLRIDKERPSPGVERHAAGGQSTDDNAPSDPANRKI